MDRIFLRQIKGRLIDYVAENSPKLYEKITNEDVMPYVCRSAYNLIRDFALAA